VFDGVQPVTIEQVDYLYVGVMAEIFIEVTNYNVELS